MECAFTGDLVESITSDQSKLIPSEMLLSWASAEREAHQTSPHLLNVHQLRLVHLCDGDVVFGCDGKATLEDTQRPRTYSNPR